MITKSTAVIYYAPTARRRFFSLDAACKAEARAQLCIQYPTEESETGDSGRVTHPGWHWSSMDDADDLYSALAMYIKACYKNA